MPLRSIAFFALALATAAAAAACDRAPSPTGLKEWTAQDHDGAQKQPSAGQAPRGDGGGGAAAALADVAWKQQCAACHGVGGRGDGPQGPMFKAPDLTAADLQSRNTDAQLAATIKNGKGRMPAFALPDDTIAGLVGKIRSFRAP